MNFLLRSWLLSYGVVGSALVMAFYAGAASFTYYGGQTLKLNLD